MARHDETDALVIIHQALEKDGFPPTHREIAEGIGYKSSASGFKMVRRLIDEGLVETIPTHPRAMRITAAGMKALEDVL